MVVVGAGLAGLACALRLHDARGDLRCVVLEARRGVGGRASRGGADWVHGQHVATWRYLKLGDEEMRWSYEEVTFDGKWWLMMADDG